MSDSIRTRSRTSQHSYELDERVPGQGNTAAGRTRTDICSASANTGRRRPSRVSNASGETSYPVSQALFGINRSHSVEKVEGHDASTRFDHPFKNWLPDEMELVASRVACEYGLGDMRDLFVKVIAAIKLKASIADIRKAGRVLRDPEPESWPTWEVSHPSELLSDEEMMALRHERTAGFWDQPWPLRTTYLMLAIAAIVQGWSETQINGANLTWWKDIGPQGDSHSNRPPTSTCQPLEKRQSYAIVNAAPYFAASIGCWVSDPLINDFLFGRRGAIAFSALFVLASAIGSAFSQHWYQLLVCRILLGIGMGCKAAVVPVFAAEIAPTHLRGSLIMNWQVFVAFGIFLGFSANLAASVTGAEAWRWQVASTAVPAFALLWGVTFICWDSPRYLMKHEAKFRTRYNRKAKSWEKAYSPRRTSHEAQTNGAAYSHEQSEEGSLPLFRQLTRTMQQVFGPNPALPYRSEAYQTLVLLRGHPVLAAKELIYAHCQLLVETRSSQPCSPHMDFSLESRSSWLGRLKGLFANAYIRREVSAAVVVMLSQQLCGINVLIAYSSVLFCSSSSNDYPAIGPLLQSWGIGLTNFLFALPAYWWIESLGRRGCLLYSLPLLAITMAIASVGASRAKEVKKALLTTFTFIFTIFYSPGLGPVPFTLSAEIFPLEHRMVGMSLAVSANFLGAGLLSFGVPLFDKQAQVLATFSGLNVLAFILVWIFVREVAGGHANQMNSLSLEELFYIFQWPLSMHIKYQRQENIPYIWGRFVNGVSSLFQRDHTATMRERPVDFYIWAEQQG